MKTLIPAAIRCSLMFTAVAAFSIVYPASVQANPTTYQYTGNPFTFVDGAYTTSDFVSGMVTLADPLAPNMALTNVSPTAFTFSDGMQTFTNLTPSVEFSFAFATGPTGAITLWNVAVETSAQSNLLTIRDGFEEPTDSGQISFNDRGFNISAPGQWTTLPAEAVADAGSTLSLMTLTLMALGLISLSGTFRLLGGRTIRTVARTSACSRRGRKCNPGPQHLGMSGG